MQSTLKEYGSVRETVLSKLRGLGLTGYASRAFLAIIENQPISAGNICKLTGIPDSKVYYALKELEEKKLIMVQHGTPSLYRTPNISQMLSGLETSVVEEYQARIKAIKGLEKLLEPLTRNNTSSEIELAYIVKGFRNISDKMKEIVSDARKEIVLMAQSERLVQTLSESLKDARASGVDVKIALTDELLLTRSFGDLRPNRSLLCDCNMLIADSQKLVTAELEAEDEYAIVTQNQSMITMSRRSYDNPTCCVRK